MSCADPILVTGSAGFIGFHAARRLLGKGHRVIGLDDLNPYYDPSLKAARRTLLMGHPAYVDHVMNLADRKAVADLFERHRPVRVVHAAAQAGIRYSVESPETYVDSNVVGFLSVLEGCRSTGVEHLVYASTSSVFGANGTLPYSVTQPVSHPLNLYAATKLANEAMAHAFAYVHGLPCTGLRFFTVYGPWGRPDMALFKFTRAILAGTPIELYGDGAMERDFTYVDDVVDWILAALELAPVPDTSWDAANPDPATSGVAPWRILNLGAGRREPLSRYLEVLERKLERKAIINARPVQPGEMVRTEADITRTRELLGYEPRTSIEEGVGRFVDWYRQFYGL
jgi:UDP-glucuronate 4-epimerase